MNEMALILQCKRFFLEPLTNVFASSINLFNRTIPQSRKITWKPGFKPLYARIFNSHQQCHFKHSAEQKKNNTAQLQPKISFELMQVSVSSITIPPRTPGDLHQKFVPTLGLLHRFICCSEISYLFKVKYSILD